MTKKRKEEDYYYETSCPYTYGLLKEYAKENRKHMTVAEKKLWDELRNNPYHFNFRHQHPIDEYIADFAFLPAHLIIEVDGAYHAERDQVQADKLRTQATNLWGFHVLRFSNDQILTDVHSVLQQINNDIFDMLENEDNE